MSKTLLALIGSGLVSLIAPSVSLGAPPEGLTPTPLMQRLGLDGSGAPKLDEVQGEARFALLAGASEESGSAHLDVYLADRQGLRREAHVRLPAGKGEPSFVWQDARHVVVLAANGKLLRIEKGRAQSLARPPARLMAGEKGDSDTRVDRDEGLIVTATNEVWLRHCTWAYEGDDDPCFEPTFGRVGGKTRVVKEAPPARREPNRDQAPTGWALNASGGPNGNGLMCTDSAQTEHRLPQGSDDSGALGVSDARWVSIAPPIAVVGLLSSGLDGMDVDERLMGGCDLVGEDTHGPIAQGPEGFWGFEDLSAENTVGAQLVLFQGRVLGRVAQGHSLAFAPVP